MLILSQLSGFGGRTSIPVTVDFGEATINTTDVSSFAMSARPPGADGATRSVIATVAWRGAVTLDAADFDEVAAVIVSQSLNGQTGVAIVASSTLIPTGDVQLDLTFSGTAACAGIGLYGVYGLNDISTATATATTNADNSAQSIDVQEGGCVFGVSASQLSTDTAAWTNITENYDAQVEASQLRHSGASITSATAQTLSLTANWTTGTTPCTLYAAFR